MWGYISDSSMVSPVQYSEMLNSSILSVGDRENSTGNLHRDASESDVLVSEAEKLSALVLKPNGEDLLSMAYKMPMQKTPCLTPSSTQQLNNFKATSNSDFLAKQPSTR